MANPIPPGYHTLTPYLRIRDAAKAIDFYKRAFGAEERGVMKMPDGKVMHAELKIGDSIVMLTDEFPQWGAVGPETLKGTSVTIHIYTTDADAAYARATAAGANGVMPPMDMFWGDRFGKVVDPFGHEWSIATHKEDLSMEEIQKRQAEFFAKQAVKKG